MFDPEYWERQGAVAGTAAGRGQVLLLNTKFGPSVLKQYLRGGWAARVSRDRYVFSGFERSRPVREFRMLEDLSEAGLPVPRPLAAICIRDGKGYSGWLMTRRIEGAKPLPDLVAERHSDTLMWREVGACIRRFHDFGLVHADLNARNILVSEGARVYLVDLDRSRFQKGDERAYSANLGRLWRSFEKIWPQPFRDQLDSCWTMLLEGYNAERRVQ